jgi:hypothetical protein
MYLSSSYSRFGVGYGADAQTGYYYWYLRFLSSLSLSLSHARG